jgi:rhodanese-related sulfurtransferase
MPRIVDRAEVRRLLMDPSTQLVEVLPREDYEDEHIAGAISLPLKELDAESVRQLDPARPVIVYCHDFQ